MKREDTDNLFYLLRIYFPQAKRLKDKQLKAAWHLLLEPYSPEIVKQALLEELRTNRHLPDPQDIAVRCQRVEPAPEAEPAYRGPSLEAYERMRRYVINMGDDTGGPEA